MDVAASVSALLYSTAQFQSSTSETSVHAGLFIFGQSR